MDETKPLCAGAGAWAARPVESAAEPAAASAATQNPRDLINGVAQQLLKELQTRREELKKDPAALRKLVDDQLAKGVSVQEQPVKRAISTQPVVKPLPTS